MIKKIIYYDIETDGIPKFKGKNHKISCVTKTTVTSVAFKEKGKKPVAFTIGVNCENEKELKEAIKPFFNNRKNTLIGWNSQGFDDPIIKNLIGTTFKCRVFDLMRGYSKFVKGYANKIKLNTVANRLCLAKDDVNPLKAWNNKEYETLMTYNIKDVELLEEIDDYFKITDILKVLMDTTKIVHPNQIFGVTAPLTSYINSHNIELGTNDKNDLVNYGGLNYYKNKRSFKDLAHFDVKSLYPYTFIALNASSNLNYNELEVIELSNTDNLIKIGNLWFNDDGTVQVKKQGNKYIGLKLTRPFKLDDGNSDIANLTSQLVEFKNSTSGALRDAYKILVNGLYGSLDSKFFDYKHKNLSSACTFVGRYILFNCINHFESSVYCKTDSIWTANTVTTEQLNEYTAGILEKIGLNTIDGKGSYLIQWELEAKPQILFIKDLNNYVEFIDGKWNFKGSFTIEAQKDILKDFIINPKTNVTEWVKNNLKKGNIRKYAKYIKLSSKQKQQFRFNTSLSDKLGLPYSYDNKVYNYYADDGYVNTEILNDKCPAVNYDYALNLCTKILNQWNFDVEVHEFKDNRPKKNKQEQKTTLDTFNNTFNKLYDVIEAIYEPWVEISSCNDLDLAMVGTGARLGYDVREMIDSVKNNTFEITESSKLARRITELKTNGYGRTKLSEYAEESTISEYVRLIRKELEPIPPRINLDSMEINYVDLKPIVKNLLNQHFNTDNFVVETKDEKLLNKEVNRIRNAFKFNESFNFHFYQTPLKVDFGNNENVQTDKNIREYFKIVENDLLNGFYSTDTYILAKNKERTVLKRDFVENNLYPFITELKELQKQHRQEMVKNAPLLKFNELVELFKTILPNLYYKHKQEIIDILTIALIMKAPVNLFLEINGSSGLGKGAQYTIFVLLYDDFIQKDTITEKGFVNEAVNDPNCYNGQTIILKDLGASKELGTQQEISKLLQVEWKVLVTDGEWSEGKTDTTTNKGTVKPNIKVNNGFKVVIYTVHSVIDQIKDIGLQVKGRTEQITLKDNIENSEDRKKYREFKKLEIEALDFNIFKLSWLKFIESIEPRELTDYAYSIIENTGIENGIDVNSKHFLGRMEVIEPYLLGAYGNDYFKYRFKPLYIDNELYRGNALKLLDIIKNHIQTIQYDEYNIDKLIEDKQIALSKSSIYQKANYEARRKTEIIYKGFTVDSIKGLKSTPFIKANRSVITRLINWLEQNDYLYSDSKTRDGKKIYVILED